jgi:hypothetical protein
MESIMKLYRGDDNTLPPALTSGTWLTSDRDAAEFYASTVHSYEVDMEDVLDLRSLGVGDDDCRDALVTLLADAGVPDAASFRGGWEELYQLCEQPAFQAAVRADGYTAVAVQQWNSDMSDEPYDSWMVV